MSSSRRPRKQARYEVVPTGGAADSPASGGASPTPLSSSSSLPGDGARRRRRQRRQRAADDDGGYAEAALAVYRRLVAASTAPQRVPTAEALNARYRRLAKVGEGSFGEVHLVYDTRSGTYATMKRMLRFLHTRGSASGLLGLHNTTCRELTLMAAMSHPNVMRLLDYHILRDGALLMLMPVAPYDFACVLRPPPPPPPALRPPGPALPLPTAKCCFRQLLEAVAYLHRRRVVHRDIKPSNLMLAADGTLLLIDFGWARLLPPRRDAAMTGPMGTLAYRPPEVLVGGRGARRYDRSVDVWCCGCVLFEMLTDGECFVRADTEAEAAGCIVDWLGSPARGSAVYTGRERLPLRAGRTGTFSARCHNLGLGKPEIQFLKRMLALEPSHRASAAAVLADPWFAAAPAACAPAELRLPPCSLFRWLESRRRRLGIVPADP